ncbi:MAG TPA: thiamine pyrophosphate-requiring protein, partial [Phycisphaerae bacterium]|nr:thiamine pyrophosphate-requiring protein [Phycisphaerae bacterium]HQE30150.1 thiamine pyrophosphate-requiring protein [Phycisphaerae bacterium]
IVTSVYAAASVIWEIRVNGLYDAKLDHMPVLAIVGQQKRAGLGSFYQQEVDLVSLFKDVAGEYVQLMTVPDQVRHGVDCAVRIAQSSKCVTCLIFPNDLQEQEAVESPPRKHGSTFSGVGYSSPRIVPRQRELERAADVLNAGERVAMLVGAGALGARAEVEQTADLLQAGVAKALLGKAVLPDHLPYVTGSIGLLGTRPSWDMMMECDTFLMIGSSFPYSEFLPPEGQARGVQIDIEAGALSLRYPMEVNLHGDAALTLQMLIPLLNGKPRGDWRARIEENVRDFWQVLEARAMNEANPINPQRLFWELSSRLPEDCIITSDSGSSANWFARDLKIRSGMMASLSGGLATMGCGCPYAVAAKFAFPHRPVVACVGDGAMQMNGNNVLITVEKYWKEWADPRFVVLVLNNQDLNQVTWEQRVMMGDPKIEISQNLPEFPYARYAELLGLRGIRVESPEAIAPAWEEALSSSRPVVIDALVDPEVPPLPPHITFEQAVAFWKAVFKGDPNRWHMIRQSFKDMVESFLPQRA